MAAAWKDPRALLAAGGLALVGRVALGKLREADLTGQVVLITGGSRGLGYLLARQFAREGCKIVICARTAQDLERAREQLESEGAEVLSVPCDLSDRASAEELVRRATERFGRVDIVVNNHGIIQIGPVDTMTHEQFQEAMDIIFWGTVNTTLAVLPQMLERRSGRIVLITSIGAKIAVPHLLPYTCAKWAQQGFAEGLRAELRKHGIRVTAIAPGTMRTGSYVNVSVNSKKQAEFGWFALGASLPVISMSAERAARYVVLATKRGDSQEVLSPQAKAAALFHGVFPGTMSDIMSVVNRLLPSSTGKAGDTVLSRDVQESIQSRLFNAATILGRTATARYQNQPESTQAVEGNGLSRNGQ